jgi:hypothetical protein
LSSSQRVVQFLNIHHALLFHSPNGFSCLIIDNCACDNKWVLFTYWRLCIWQQMGFVLIIDDCVYDHFAQDLWVASELIFLCLKTKRLGSLMLRHWQRFNGKFNSMSNFWSLKICCFSMMLKLSYFLVFIENWVHFSQDLYGFCRFT